MTGRSVRVTGAGAVTAAGWGKTAFLSALDAGRPLVPRPYQRCGTSRAVNILPVPPPSQGSPWSRHPRLRRCSPLTRYAMAAAAEALGPDRMARVQSGHLRLGIVMSVFSGCVVYSERFLGEVLDDPGLASPILFPETVYNAPGSHLAAVLGSKGPCCTFVGDSAQFLPASETGIRWILEGRTDAALVVGAEELDWPNIEAWALFGGAKAALGEGAGAVLLEQDASEDAPGIEQITDPETYGPRCSPFQALRRVRDSLAPETGARGTALIDSLCGSARRDAAEEAVWRDWTGPRLSPARIVGDSLGAAGALQVVAASLWIESGRCVRALISGAGQNQQSVGAILTRM